MPQREVNYVLEEHLCVYVVKINVSYLNYGSGYLREQDSDGVVLVECLFYVGQVDACTAGAAHTPERGQQAAFAHGACAEQDAVFREFAHQFVAVYEIVCVACFGGGVGRTFDDLREQGAAQAEVAGVKGYEDLWLRRIHSLAD